MAFLTAGINSRQTRLGPRRNGSVGRRTENDSHSVFLRRCILMQGVVAGTISVGSLSRKENILEPGDSETAAADCRDLSLERIIVVGAGISLPQHVQMLGKSASFFGR